MTTADMLSSEPSFSAASHNATAASCAEPVSKALFTRLHAFKLEISSHTPSDARITKESPVAIGRLKMSGSQVTTGLKWRSPIEREQASIAQFGPQTRLPAPSSG